MNIDNGKNALDNDMYESIEYFDVKGAGII